jgi:hypothetical protein
MRHLRLVAGLWLAVMAPAQAAPLSADVISMFEKLSLPVPQPPNVLICHGFGCYYRTAIGLSAGDRGRLQSIMAGARTSPAAERKAIGDAYAWFEKRVGPEAGTSRAIARTTPGYSKDRGQFDCFDKTHNATELLALLVHFGLMHHHTIDVPQSRGYLINLRPHHTTAVIREKVSGRRWSVDGWTRANGQQPDIMPMEKWADLD